MNTDALRALLLGRAERDARTILAEADSEAARVRGEARRQATTTVEQAAREGEVVARHQADIDLRTTRRKTRARLLAAERTSEDRLLRDAVTAVLALRGDSAYPSLLDALTRLAGERLGPDATIERDPPGRGGVLARAGTRTLDLTLASLAMHALEAAAAAHAPEVVEAA
ncbi:MAG TPA: V-type ATP synthase subunit E family protein [Candidatus Deferrimicrobium sp.]|nr:V-type ATP synthase subunit E family protein [Candidatus Deferrimicrobium sp.]